MNLMHHTAILWRGPGSVQIGGDRSRHVRLDDLHASDQLWLASQKRRARCADTPEASPELLAALRDADLIDRPDRRPLLSVGIIGAVPATVLAIRSLVDTVSLTLRVDAPTLVDGDWDHVFGGNYTGTPRARAVRRELSSLIFSMVCAKMRKKIVKKEYVDERESRLQMVFRAAVLPRSRAD